EHRAGSRIVFGNRRKIDCSGLGARGYAVGRDGGSRGSKGGKGGRGAERRGIVVAVTSPRHSERSPRSKELCPIARPLCDESLFDLQSFLHLLHLIYLLCFLNLLLNVVQRQRHRRKPALP